MWLAITLTVPPWLTICPSRSVEIALSIADRESAVGAFCTPRRLTDAEVDESVVMLEPVSSRI